MTPGLGAVVHPDSVHDLEQTQFHLLRPSHSY